MGTMKFSVIDEATGSSNLQGFHGSPCSPGAVYYFGQYTDPESGAGLIYACMAGPGNLVGRYKDGPTGTEGDLNFTFSAPASWSGFNTADGFSGNFPISGTFAGHFTGDGCCPSSNTPPPTTTTSTPPATGETIPTNWGSGTSCDNAASNLDAYIAQIIRSPSVAQCRAVSPREKAATREMFNDAVLLYATMCPGDLEQALVTKFEHIKPYCGAVILVMAILYKINKDPASGSFNRVALVGAPGVGSPLTELCPSGCPGAAPAAAAYARAQAAAEAALSGLSIAADRLSGARRSHSNSGILLQAGVASAYAGEVAATGVDWYNAATALSDGLAAAGHSVALSAPQLTALRVQVQRGLPPALVKRLNAAGLPAAAFKNTLVAALGQAQPIPFSQVLHVPVPQPSGPFHAVNAAITANQVIAIITALAKQRAITIGALGVLLGDVHAGQVRSAAQRAAAVAKLERDIAARTRGAAGTLLHYAAVGLAG